MNITVSITDAQKKAIELLNNQEGVTVDSIVKNQVLAFAKSQVKSAVENALNRTNPNVETEPFTDEELSKIFTDKFLSKT